MLNKHYEELYRIVVKENGISLNEKLSIYNKYITVQDYLIAVSERGGHDFILSLLKTMKLNPNEIRAFLKGAAANIIMNTLSGNEEYVGYYKDKLKNVV
ncbi:hypothetical protein [Viridibacillus arvi]|uniref:hypothetical protein n=1 Tax=Viridibacillus arvi TaxID=263475 RepID=UPI0034CDB2A3